MVCVSCQDEDLVLSGWLSRAVAVNCRFADHCKSNGWTFIDNWKLLYGKDTLYARDGVHLSYQGVPVMPRTRERELNTLQHFFVIQEMNKTCRKDREDRIAEKKSN